MVRSAVWLWVLTALAAVPAWGQERGVERLIDFGTEARQGDWLVVNDGVMGGRSSGAIEPAAGGIAVFEGVLSLENNGGFASVRTVVEEGALAGATRVLIRVRGDGNRYQLRLRPGDRFDGVAWAASFDTPADEWTTVALPLTAFEPTYRGYRPRGAGPVDAASVRQIGLMLTDKQTGPFRLEIEWIGVDGGAPR